MSNWQDLASTHSLQMLCEMAVKSIELQAQVAELKAKLSESTSCDEPWKPIVGEECSIVFGNTKEHCTVLALHKNRAWITSGKTGGLLTVEIPRLTREEW